MFPGKDGSKFSHRGHTLRRGRVSIPGHAYLVTTVTREREPLFADFDRARIVACALERPSANLRCESLAWVVMPDHIHWLVRLDHAGTISGAVRSLKGRVARLVNFAQDQEGCRVWQPGFHDHALRREEDLRATARYIIANPLRAGLVDRIGDYPYWNAVWI